MIWSAVTETRKLKKNTVLIVAIHCTMRCCCSSQVTAVLLHVGLLHSAFIDYVNIGIKSWGLKGNAAGALLKQKQRALEGIIETSQSDSYLSKLSCVKYYISQSEVNNPAHIKASPLPKLQFLVISAIVNVSEVNPQTAFPLWETGFLISTGWYITDSWASLVYVAATELPLPLLWLSEVNCTLLVSWWRLYGF